MRKFRDISFREYNMNIHKSDRTPPLVTLEVHLFEIKKYGMVSFPAFALCVWRKKEGDTVKK